MEWLPLVEQLEAQLDPTDEPITRSIFGSPDPLVIGLALERFAQTSLGAGIDACGYIYVSVGATFVVRLQTGTVAVIKAYGVAHGQRALRPPALQASFTIQAKLATIGFPCPGVQCLPQIQGQTLFVAQDYCSPGEAVEPLDPAVRRTMALGLADLIAQTQGLDCPPDLAPWMPWLSGENGLWPTPHNALFDFEQTQTGAEWIDAIAAQAQAQLRERVPTLPAVIGHADWSLQNMAFYGGQLTCVFDWDSLRRGPEACFVGGAARCYAHDWRDSGPPRPLLIAEATAFIQDYVVFRGRGFTAVEQQAIAAAMVYTVAYGARCSHAIAPDSPWNRQICQQLRDFQTHFLSGEDNPLRFL